MVQTYGLESQEERSGNKKVSNQLAHNPLETLPKYGHICEKIFSSSKYRPSLSHFSTKNVYIVIVPTTNLRTTSLVVTTLVVSNNEERVPRSAATWKTRRNNKKEFLCRGVSYLR